MANPALFEETFRKYITNLNDWIPDGMIYVDLNLLQSYELLDDEVLPPRDPNDFTRFFHVIEGPDKITLFNDNFVVWIVPQVVEGQAMTYTLVALNENDNPPKLEMAFATSGVYNTSKLVLRILEKFLIEIQENEDIIHFLDKSS